MLGTGANIRHDLGDQIEWQHHQGCAAGAIHRDTGSKHVLVHRRHSGIGDQSTGEEGRVDERRLMDSAERAKKYAVGPGVKSSRAA